MIPDGTVTIGLVVIAFAVAVATVSVVMFFNNRTGQIRDEAAEERRKLSDAIAALRLHIAETYMSKASGGMAIDRAVTEIKGLRTDLKDEMTKLGDRIERMENHVLTGNR